MKYILDDSIVEKSELTMGELLILLLIKLGVNIHNTIKEMENKEMIKCDMFNHFAVYKKWDIEATNLLLKGDAHKSDDSLIKLAKTLREIFPKGKKPGTTKQFRSNTTNVVNKLRRFFKEYGTKYTSRDIINATQKYVTSFNGNYSYMRVLEYFIWKDVKKIDSEGVGYTERVSDLADYLENDGQDEVSNRDWTSELV